MDIGAQLRKAVELHRSGDMVQAERIYRQVLLANEQNADAQHLFGLLLRQRGNVADAIDHLIKACVVLPSNARFLIDCGKALHEYRYYEDAAAFYSLALRIEPDNERIWFSLGCAHHRAGNLDAALGALSAAIERKPDFFEALCNCAEIFRLRNEIPQAVSCMQRALAVRPGFAEGHNALGQLYESLQKPEKALSHYHKAIQADKTCAHAYNNIGTILSARGEGLEAITYFTHALTLRPDFFEAQYNLGNCYRDLNALDVALDCFEAAIKLKPQYAPALANYSEAFMSAGRLSEAHHWLKAACAIPGDHQPASYSNVLLYMNYDPAVTPLQLHDAHCRMQTMFPAEPFQYCLDTKPDRKLRVGYVSADFCNHPVARFIEPILTHHDRSMFELFCYANQRRTDAVTRRLQSLPLSWRNIYDVDDAQARCLIIEDHIDILVDLAGHTAGNRLPLFSKKCAPVQISYCGYPNTTGVAAIDYYITDDFLDCHDDERLYSERLIRLPDCFCCYQPGGEPPLPAEPPCLQNGFITFGSLHPLVRLNSAVIDLWCALLQAIPSARLRIVRDTLRGNVGRRLAEEFIQRGIPITRIDLENRVPSENHLTLYNSIDIALDTFPWSGHTTACEALWMGVPVITLYGNRHAGRMAATILRAAGLSEWIAFSEEHYCEIARNASRSYDSLAHLRKGLPSRMAGSVVGNADKCTRSLEAAYKTVWMRWRYEQP